MRVFAIFDFKIARQRMIIRQTKQLGKATKQDKKTRK